ncbi:MAG: high frequency lysogenization protein HflD [Gammaproteobacteria bacterium]|nr:high frequency lysogenization protein HflD [Gammaproteobacteria bacterium]
MNARQRDQTLALAGIFQAASLVQQIAYRGTADQRAMDAIIGSVLQLEADSVEDVYGGVEGVARGLSLLRDQIRGSHGERDMELTKYVIALLHLERRLARRPQALEHIRGTVLETREQARYFSSNLHETVIARLGELYVEAVSTLGPRIMVSGERTQLSDPGKANLIRALLLGGIRSAVMWRQKGGRRLQLLFARRRLLAHAEALLEALPAP